MKSISHILLLVAVGLAVVVAQTSGQTDCNLPKTQTWLRVSDASGAFDTLWFGFDLTATACRDSHLCEGYGEIPPPPPPGVFDARFLLPQMCFPAASVKRDYRRYFSRTQVDTHKLYFQPSDPPGYPMTFRWSSSAVAALCDSAILRDEFGGSFVNVPMHQVNSLQLTQSQLTRLVLYRYGAKQPQCLDSLTLSVSAGWHSLTLPITVPNRSVRVVFPTAISSGAMRYIGGVGYVFTETLEYGGIGYWIKFVSSGLVTLCGTLREVDTIRIVAGWHFIGNTISYDIPTDSIIQIPPGIVQFCPSLPPSGCDTLRVGQPRWVKAMSNGLLILRRVVRPTGVGTFESPAQFHFALEQNYPNPFNPETVIRYQLPVAGLVTLKVYNLLGQEVAILRMNEETPAGSYNIEWRPEGLASGVYFYRLTTGAYIETKKLLYLR